MKVLFRRFGYSPPEPLCSSTSPREGGEVRSRAGSPLWGGAGGGGKIATLMVALMLAACGFHPLYGSIGNEPGVGTVLSGIFVEPIPERVGYELRNNLLDLFNATGSEADFQYRLKLYLMGKEEAVVQQANTSITRYNYTLTAHYELAPKGATSAVKTGDVTALAAYDVAAAPFLFSTATAQRDAQNRAANEIAERIRTELAVYLRQAALTAMAPAPLPK